MIKSTNEKLQALGLKRHCEANSQYLLRDTGSSITGHVTLTSLCPFVMWRSFQRLLEEMYLMMDSTTVDT